MPRNRTIKELRRIADRLGVPLRANERKAAIEQEILSYLNAPRIWNAIMKGQYEKTTTNYSTS